MLLICVITITSSIITKLVAFAEAMAELIKSSEEYHQAFCSFADVQLACCFRFCRDALSCTSHLDIIRLLRFFDIELHVL